MSLSLAIDIGNTTAKIGLFDRDRLIEKWSAEELTESFLFEHTTNHFIKIVILSSVRGPIAAPVLAYLESRYKVIQLNAQTPLPIQNHYLTPETLGRDRLAAVVGANFLYPDQNNVVIDAGTCITYDLINASGVFLGGNIAPGLTMRLQAMHQLTANLPLVDKKVPESPIGISTETALQNGGLMGAFWELEAFLAFCKRKLGSINVILTGGDADFFAKRMKREIFVNHDLVLIGLNKILQYNEERLY